MLVILSVEIWLLLELAFPGQCVQVKAEVHQVLFESDDCSAVCSESSHMMLEFCDTPLETLEVLSSVVTMTCVLLG